MRTSRGRPRLPTWLGRALVALFVLPPVIAWAEPAPGAPPAAPAATAFTPLPAEEYGRLPRIFAAALSPDGTKVALGVSDDNGLQAYQVVDADTGQLLQGARVGTGAREEERSVMRGVGWASNQHVSYVLSATFRTQRALPADVVAPGQNRIDLWRTGIADLTTNRDYFVTLGEGRDWGMYLANFVAPLAGAPDEGRLLAYDSQFRGRRMTVYRVNLANGSTRRLQQGTVETQGFLLDATGNPVVRVDSDPATNRWSLRQLVQAGDHEIASGQSPTGNAPTLAGLLANGDLAFVDDPDSRGRDVLYAMSPQDGSTRVLLEDAEHDVARAILDPWTRQVVGALIVEELATQHFLDPQLAEVHAMLARAYTQSSVHLLNWSSDRKRFMVFMQRPVDAGAYYLFEPATSRLRVIGRVYPRLEGVHLGDRLGIRYPARDGTMVPAYLTLPAGRSLEGLPLVVLVHGGPTVRDTFEFDWWSSFLASRGYAVVQPNYRGSAGYGKAWQEAGYRNWGTLMQDDVEDAVNVLTQPGKADPARVCIVGASYGGYAALAGITLKPGRYACAASVAGVADLPMMLDNVARTTGEDSATSDWWRMLIGDREQEVERLRAISPAWQAANARAPVLLLHGANDVVVPVKQSRRMAEALQEAGRQVEYIEFPGEDHWLSDGATRVRMLKELERFLALHLAPASAP